MIAFQVLFTREASVDKCITLMTETLPVNVPELQPSFLFKERQLSQLILEAAVRKRSLKQLF